MTLSNLLNKVLLSVLFQINNNYQSSKGIVQNYLDEKSIERLKHFRKKMIMMMICFVAWLTDERRLAYFPYDHCQRFSPSRISDTTPAGFRPAQNLCSGLVERSSAVVITTTPRRQLFDQSENSIDCD